MHSIDDEIEICTWHTKFLLLPWSSMLMIGIALPIFPVKVPILVLVERLHSRPNSSGVRFVSNFFAVGFIGDGVFLLGSESDDSEIDVSHSNLYVR